MKDSKLSLLVAGLALFIVLGGTAVAASGLIDGKKIKKGTITGKQIKNRTITSAKLNPSARKGLQGQTGQTGARGSTGPKGATGTTGSAGDDGIISPLTANGTTVNLTQLNQGTEAVHVDLSAGTYLVTARANVTSQRSGNNEITCSLVVDNVDDFDIVDDVNVGPLILNESASLPLMAVTPVDQKVTVLCAPDAGAAQISSSKIIAVPVG